jgi:hypothetical protein
MKKVQASGLRLVLEFCKVLGGGCLVCFDGEFVFVLSQDQGMIARFFLQGQRRPRRMGFFSDSINNSDPGGNMLDMNDAGFITFEHAGREIVKRRRVLSVDKGKLGAVVGAFSRCWNGWDGSGGFTLACSVVKELSDKYCFLSISACDNGVLRMKQWSPFLEDSLEIDFKPAGFVPRFCAGDVSPVYLMTENFLSLFKWNNEVRFFFGKDCWRALGKEIGMAVVVGNLAF